MVDFGTRVGGIHRGGAGYLFLPSLLGMIDRQIKSVSDTGADAAGKEPPPQALLKECLYDVALAARP